MSSMLRSSSREIRAIARPVYEVCLAKLHACATAYARRWSGCWLPHTHFRIRLYIHLYVHLFMSISITEVPSYLFLR